MSEQAVYGSANEKEVEKQTVFRASEDVLMAKAGGPLRSSHKQHLSLPTTPLRHSPLTSVTTSLPLKCRHVTGFHPGLLPLPTSHS